MPGKKTSVEQTREEEKNAQVGNMLDAAFGGVEWPCKSDSRKETRLTRCHWLLRILSEEPMEPEALSRR